MIVVPVDVVASVYSPSTLQAPAPIVPASVASLVLVTALVVVDSLCTPRVGCSISPLVDLADIVLAESS